MIATRKPLSLLLVLSALTGCGKVVDGWFCASEGCDWSDREWKLVASLANPGPPPGDASNALSTDLNAIQMGQTFFFDPAFSGTATQKDAINRDSPPARVAKKQPLGIACATCHDLSRAGVDTSSQPGQVSIGAGWTDVNALPVVNSAYHDVVFWNGRADSLWALNVAVAESATTMNGNRLRTAHEIVDRYLPAPFFLQQIQKQFPQYPVGDCTAIAALYAGVAALPPDGKPGAAGCDPSDPNEPFGDAYDCLTPDQQTMVTTLLVIWSKAIAAYEYQLTSVESDFDRFVREGPGSDAIPEAAKRGARLFVGKAACIDCHSGPMLSDELFHDIGIPQTGLAAPTTADCPAGNLDCDCSEDSTGPCAPWGAWAGLKKLQASKFLRTGSWSDDRTDTSRGSYVSRPVDPTLKGAWRTPSLRNVALTAPYMHDGRYATLQDVVWHYDTGGQNAGPEQIGVMAAQIKPLLLTDGEQADLIAFLETLTGAPVPSAHAEALAPPPAGAAQGASLASLPGCMGTRPQPACLGTPPASPLVTDFSDATDAPIRFGAAPGISGGAFAYAAPGLISPALTVGPGANGTPALHVEAHPGAPPDPSATFFGFGLSFDSCTDATRFGAIQFTLNGSLGGCTMRFAFASAENTAIKNDPRGTCTLANCYPPSTPVTSSGAVTIPFGVGPFEGNPNVFDPRSLVGVQWQMDAPPGGCDASFTIDDVSFVPSGPPPTGTGGFGGSTGPGAGGAGGAGPTGAGGSQATGPCAMPLAVKTITSFSDALPGNPIAFKTVNGTGQTFSTGPSSAPPPSLSIAADPTGNAVLQAMARPSLRPDGGAADGMFEFGLVFDPPLDATGFNGIRFTAMNRIVDPSCPLGVIVRSRQSGGGSPGGACAPPGCSELASGPVLASTSCLPLLPNPGELTAITEIAWQEPDSCNLLVTIDDVGFVKE